MFFVGDRLEDNQHRKNEKMKSDKTILNINRHLFYKGTNDQNRVLRSFVPRGSTPCLQWLQSSFMSHKQLFCSESKGGEQSRNAQTKIEFASLGIPFAQNGRTQPDFPRFWCSSLFCSTTIKTT